MTNVHRHFGAVPEPGALTDADSALLASVENGFETVGTEIEAARFKAALAAAMALAREVNQYLSEQAPWAQIESDRARAATVLYVALRCIDNLKVLLTPFLPFSSQALHEMLGYDGYLAGPLRFQEVEEEDGSAHRVLTGDYESWVGRWEPSTLQPGQTVAAPQPLFKKLDPGIVEDELARMDPERPSPEPTAA